MVKSKDKFENEIFHYLPAHYAEIIPLTLSAANNAIQRAIERIPPCRTSGEGVRDAIIWCQILEIVQNRQGKAIAFISENTKEFTNNNNKELHNKLREDLQRLNFQLSYYVSLEEFIREHALPIEHITKEWIEGKITTQNVVEQTQIFLSKPLSNDKISLFMINDEFLKEYYRIIDIDEITITSVEFDDFIVWEFGPGTIELAIDYHANINGVGFCELLESRVNPEFMDEGSFQNERELECNLHANINLVGKYIDDQIVIDKIEKIERY